jgi:hypothetical protein
MRRFSILCAALGLAATGLVATSPAQASFKVIRWDGTGVCQIWDNAVPTKPFPTDYKVVSHPVPTFMDALATKDKLFHAARCTL